MEKKNGAKNNEHKRKGGGGKLSRSETITVRLDPKLRYLAELAARAQRRTLSSYIEWSIQISLKQVKIVSYANYDVPISDVEESLWDVDESDRFVKLALHYPSLLTHEEQVLWKLICENGHLWKGKFDKGSGEWGWAIERDTLNFERLREYWRVFNSVAKGDAGKDVLPTWIRNKSDSSI